MPAPVHVIIITPIASIPTMVAALGISAPTATVYTAADAAPRMETHRARSGSVTSGQRAILDAHLVTPNPALADSIILDWPRDQPNPYAQLLEDNGLTLSAE